MPETCILSLNRGSGGILTPAPTLELKLLIENFDFGFKDLKTVFPPPLELGLLMENFDFGFEDLKNLLLPPPLELELLMEDFDSVETMLYAGRLPSRLFSLSLETSLKKSIY